MVKGIKYGKTLQKMRQLKVVNLRCTGTPKDAEPVVQLVTVAANRLNQLSGNGISSFDLYTLIKTGKMETEDIYGTKFMYEIVIPEEVKNESPSTDSTTTS